LPNSLSESMVMFHQSNVENLKKIKEFLNGWSLHIDTGFYWNF
jgi:hypothetical protein